VVIFFVLNLIFDQKKSPHNLLVKSAVTWRMDINEASDEK